MVCAYIFTSPRSSPLLPTPLLFSSFLELSSVFQIRHVFSSLYMLPSICLELF